MVVDGVDEGNVDAFGVEKFSQFQHGIDVALGWVRHEGYMWFLSVIKGMRFHFLFLVRQD